MPHARRAPERPLGKLPLELTSFVVREKEIAEVKKKLLADNRLLMLTGPGGCGKTRLALTVAFEVVESFEDGMRLVKLASLSDPDLVPQALHLRRYRAVPGALREHRGSYRAHPYALLLLGRLDPCPELIEVGASSVKRYLLPKYAQRELSRITGIPQRTISDLLRGVTPQNGTLISLVGRL